jgi:hypothetical protein
MAMDAVNAAYTDGATGRKRNVPYIWRKNPE